MPDDTNTVNPESDFRGTSRSFTVLQGGAGWPTCKSCGSTIYPQRRVSLKVRVVAGERWNVEKYRCACGVGREVRRAAA